MVGECDGRKEWIGEEVFVGFLVGGCNGGDGGGVWRFEGEGLEGGRE